MKRGTRVGQAYVALSVDGSGINDDISDSLDDADLKDVANKHGKQYRKTLGDHLQGLEKDWDQITDRIGNRLSSRLEKAVTTDSNLDKHVSKMLAKAFDDGDLDSLMERVGERAGVNIGRGVNQHLGAQVLDSLEESLQKAARSGNFDLSSILFGADSGSGNVEILGPGIDNAVRRVHEANNKMLADAERANREYERFWHERLDQEERGQKIIQAMHLESAKVWERLLTQREKDEAEATRFFQREEMTRLANERSAGLLRIKQEEHEAKERLKIRREYEAEVGKLLDRRADDRSFLRTSKAAERMLSNVKWSPKLDEDDVQRAVERLRASLEARNALKLQLTADLPEREIAAIKARLRTLDGQIRLDIDQEHLNRSLLATKARTSAAGGLGGGGDGFDVGRLFGAGSRNNALNLIGKAIGGVVKIMKSAVDVSKKMFSTFMQGFNSLEEGASFLQKSGAGFQKLGAAGAEAGAALGSAAAAAAPVIVAAIAAVIVAASMLVSVLGALLALATALTSAIVSGLTGAVLVLGGAFAAAAAAGGLLVLAFTSMTDAQRTLLTDAFQPLKAALTGIGQILLNEMVPAFQTWANNLKSAIMLIVPVAQVMGQAFADAGNRLTAAFSGPGFVQFTQALAVYLPSIIRNLASALGDFLNGLAGMFGALMPLVNRFAGYLANVAKRFGDWATSAKGQNSIQDFADRAVESLKSLWGFVREFVGFISDVLFNPTSQQAGNTIFDKLAGAFAKFRKAFQKAAKDGSLQKWFDDAIEFGGHLWSVIVSIYDIFKALYNSGVLKGTGILFEYLAGTFKTTAFLLTPLIDMLGSQIEVAFAVAGGAADAFRWSIDAIKASIISAGEAIEWFGGLMNAITPGSAFGNGAEWDHAADAWSTLGQRPQTVMPAGAPLQKKTPNLFAGLNLPKIDWNSLVSSGNSALDATSTEHGGNLDTSWKNPYVAWANSLIKDGPGDARAVQKALRDADRMMRKALKDGYKALAKGLKQENKIAAKAIREASKAEDSSTARGALQDAIKEIGDKAKATAKAIKDSAKATAETLRSSAKSTVETAQSTLNSAASSLASASTPEAAAQALAQVHKAQAVLAEAQRVEGKINARADRIVAKAQANAAKLAARTAKANKILSAQKVVNSGNVAALVAGLKVQNATLADFAAARSKVAAKIEEANTKLADAIQIRDSFLEQVSSSIKDFGALTTAQAKVIDGIEQALTASDIVDNLQDRLDKIKNFQDNLRQLLALGLSNDAYKQIVDAGVETGSSFAEAILEGGIGAVDQVNDLTGKINGIADELGLETSNRMYQAGVDAAQGLVDGLESLSDKLDAAATRLGDRIAKAVKKALGIKSPSTVMRDLMTPVGDGAVIGLDAQHAKVGVAATRLANQIAVSPEVAQYAARQGTTPVSGNPVNDIDITVVTPTENPHAVAMEVLNEVTGRL